MVFKNMNIALVEDDKDTISIIKRYCNEVGITLTKFKDPLQAMTFLIQQEVDLLIVKNQFKYFKGIDIATEFRKNHEQIPIMMLKEEEDKKTLYEQALKAGVNEFISKPFNYVELKLRIENLLKLRELNNILNDKTKLLKEEIQNATSNIKKDEFELLEVLSKTTEYKNQNIAIHTARVAEYSRLLAQKYGLSDHIQNIIFHAAPLHDIGKVGIPDILLRTPRELKHKEFEIVKKHTLIGYNILKSSNNEFLEAGAIIALTHHEKYDGSGYPNKLQGDDIHIYGRITAVADVFDALLNKRCYKEAWSIDKVVEFFKSERDKHFDGKLVDILLENIDFFKAIVDNDQ